MFGFIIFILIVILSFLKLLKCENNACSGMQRHCEVDSGRSSCSAGSIGAPIVEIQNKVVEDFKQTVKYRIKPEPVSNTELKVSSRPRSCTHLLQKSPTEYDKFPYEPHKPLIPEAKPLISQSTLEIASSTRLDDVKPIKKDSDAVKSNSKLNDKRRLVQRSASRLYRAEPSKNGTENVCIGPEFIVRATQPFKLLDISSFSPSVKRDIIVILLNGHRIKVSCDPNTTTAGQIFEAIIQSEKYEHGFMLGMAVLLAGDFVFLPDEYKIKKVAPDGWCPKSNYKLRHLKRAKAFDSNVVFTVYLRIKFFLPPNISKNLLGGDWRHRLYLQLRRSTLEGQLTATTQQLIQLAGYALHIEFGEFFYREHGSGDYFLLEHYLPEGSYPQNTNNIKLQMKRAHESRRGLDKESAILNFIILAQTFKDYGAHFYSAVWATRDGFSRDVWFSIAPRGIILFSRNTSIMALPQEAYNGVATARVVLQSIPWLQIHTFYCNKKTLYIVLKSHTAYGKNSTKYKLKMDDNKSYYTYWLASLHHRFYLKLNAEHNFLQYLSDELSSPVSPKYSNENNINILKKTDASISSGDFSDYPESYHIALRNESRLKKPVKRKFTFNFHSKKSDINKENEIPVEKFLQNPLAKLNGSANSIKLNYSSNECLSSSESCSLPRRQGVKMGTKAINGTPRKSTLEKPSVIRSSTFSVGKLVENQTNFEQDMASTHSDSDDIHSIEIKSDHCDINKMELLPQRIYNSNRSAFVIESPKVFQDNFYAPTNDETCTNASVLEKLDLMGCVQGERCFVTALLQRDKCGTLGLQVAEGSDGNVYIKSITQNGPADQSKRLQPGDQIISVNGQTLLNVQYITALKMLQAAPSKVEIIVLQNVNTKNKVYTSKLNSRNSSRLDLTSNVTSESLASGLDDMPIDDEILNEEALKTIHALISLTKQNVIMRMKEKSNLSAPNKLLLQKCLSENKVYDESGVGNESHEIKTIRNSYKNCKQLPNRRPLSLHIPAEELPLNYLDIPNYLDDSVNLRSSENLSITNKFSLPGKSVAVPRNFSLSRRWLGPVRYPVTPCKNVPIQNGVTKRFLYRDSDDDQIFL